ncbi:MAG: hypothetical protein HYV54_01990 [Parcubacteria group bacterium]|nr:hypothetical protein [Parcubacteria group bacterium]
MSRTDAAVIIMVCGVIGFILGMTVPSHAFQIKDGFFGTIIGAGIGTVICAVYINLMKEGGK